jgi:hypothetical protein
VLVRACQRLKKLVISIDRYTDITNKEIHRNDLSGAIAYHSVSLEELVLRLVEDRVWDEYRLSSGSIPLQDCLKGMHQLRRLNIGVEFLYRKLGAEAREVELVSDRLPSSLEHLVLETTVAQHPGLRAKHTKHMQDILKECSPDGCHFH